MNSYICLNKQTFNLGDYTIVPIRFEDRLNIMRWRNEQIFHLRQNHPLTEKDQDNYFINTINKLFTQDRPAQILFSLLKNNECIGYGGLVHINWIDQHAEISFIMNTSLEKEYFESNWGIYLNLIQQVAFEELKLHKIFTYAFDVRSHLYPALEKVGFQEDARLKEHCFFQGKFIDVVIHSKTSTNYYSIRKATIEDAQLLFDWTNDPQVRANSFQVEPILWENHLNWFTQKLISDSYIFLLTTPNQPIGVIRFDCRENDYLLNYSISDAFRGKGMGTKIVENGLNTLRKEIQKTFSVTALVKDSNLASLAIFRKLAFAEEIIENQTHQFKLKI